MARRSAAHDDGSGDKERAWTAAGAGLCELGWGFRQIVYGGGGTLLRLSGHLSPLGRRKVHQAPSWDGMGWDGGLDLASE